MRYSSKLVKGLIKRLQIIQEYDIMTKHDADNLLTAAIVLCLSAAGNRPKITSEYKEATKSTHRADF